MENYKVMILKICKALVLLLAFYATASAHGDEDHGEEKKAATNIGKDYFTATSISGLYELVMYYPPVKSGKLAKFKLFLSDFSTNIPVHKANIQLSVAEDANIKLKVIPIDSGVYEVSGTFPKDAHYALTANINSYHGADLLLVENIAIGQELDTPEETKTTENPTNPWISRGLYLLGGLGLGVLISLLLRRRTRSNNKI